MPYRKHVDDTEYTRREQAAERRDNAERLKSRGQYKKAEKESQMSDMLKNQAGITRSNKNAI